METLSKFKPFRRKPRKPKIISYKSRANFLLKPSHSEAKLKILLYSFCEVTQINGFHYLGRGKTGGTLRIFWSLVPFSMLIFGCVLINLLAETYYDHPAVIVRLKPRFTSQNPFPAISICPHRPFIESKISKFVRET